MRGPDGALRAALAGPHAAVFVLGGHLSRFGGGRGRGAQAAGVRKRGSGRGHLGGHERAAVLSRRIEGVISPHRHVIELAKEAGLLTIHRLFAIDSGAVERGIKPIRRADSHCVEILPALAFPEIAADHPELLERPVLAGGLLKSEGSVAAVLAAGAAGVSTSHRGLWRAERRLSRGCGDARLDADFRQK